MARNNNNGTVPSSDDLTIHDVILAVHQLTHTVAELVKRYDAIVKYLLLTVCALALGKGLIEVIDFFKR